MIFKTHKENIPQIEAILEAFGTCFFHGDGNMYTKEEDSNFRKEFGNPKTEEGKYRVKFVKGQAIPQTVEELNNALMEARNREILAGQGQVTNSALQTITVKKKEAAEGSKLKVQKPYNQMKKDELTELATERSLEIPDGAKVSDLIELLENADQA